MSVLHLKQLNQGLNLIIYHLMSYHSSSKTAKIQYFLLGVESAKVLDFRLTGDTQLIKVLKNKIIQVKKKKQK
jgi:CII-binding regulator of phage lambda lysogenization HflD